MDNSVIDLSNNAAGQSLDQPELPLASGPAADASAPEPPAVEPVAAAPASAEHDRQAVGQPVPETVAPLDGPTESTAPPAVASEVPAPEPTASPPSSGPDETAEEITKDWYVLKVQSNREESIREGLLRRINIEGLEPYFGDIVVPTELRSEFKSGRKRVLKVKLWPGYLVVNMAINDATWHLVRGTPGIGDFVGSTGRPTPMLPQDVAKILKKQEEETDEVPKLKIKFNPGDRVKITEGTFENFEGTVESIDVPNGRVTVMINIFGRSTPVELEYWQIEGV